MFIKVENENILDHHHEVMGSINIEIPNQVLIDTEGTYFGIYRFKYVDGQLVALTDEEKKAHPVRIANKMAEIRQERDRLLMACDYIIMPDYPATQQIKNAYIAYRQELRDLPANITDVDNVTYPVKP